MKNFKIKFLEELEKNELDSEYKIIEQNSGFMRLQHICGNTLNARFDKFFHFGERCFFCQVRDITNSEYKVIKYLSDSKSNYIVRHMECGNEFQITRRKFEQGFRCPKCHKNIIRDLISFKNRIKEIYEDDIEILSDEFKYTKDIVEFKCNICGKIDKKASHRLLSGRGCQCNYHNSKSHSNDYIVKQITELFSDIEVLSEYKGYDKDITLRHKICNTEFNRKPRDILRYTDNCACPVCHLESIGEFTVREYLVNHNIIFKEQISFPECYYKKPLKFDFVIYTEDGDILCIVEFDGPQHEENYIGKSTFVRTREEWEELNLKDKLKDNFCKNQNIPLLRIKYKFRKSTQEILENFLSNFKDYRKHEETRK